MGFLDKFTSKRGIGKNWERDAQAIHEERRALLSADSDFYIREAYKTLRTNVSFSMTGDEECKVIVVTSSMQGEGKSITAANLAISYAMAERKVLLIDCDLRRPKIARLLQMNSKVGLSNLIIQPKLIDQVILSSKVHGLDVILSGDIPPNPSELLGSARMKSLIEGLRTSYDYIIMDAPPVNMVTDAVVLAPESDGVLFLVRANWSERGAVIHAVEQLEYVKAKILGFVLNDVDMERAHYGGKGYTYRRYLRYGHSKYGYGSDRVRGYGYSSSMPIYQDETE